MDLAAVIAAQDGVFSRAQALRAGYSAAEVRNRVRRGSWQRVYGGVLAPAGPLSRLGIDRAACLAAGRGAVLGGGSAAVRLRIDVTGPRPCVLIPVHHHVRLPGATVRHTHVPDSDLLMRDGLLVTCPARTVVDCLLAAEQRSAPMLLDRALQQGWLDVEELSRRAHAAAGHPGAPRLARLVRSATQGARSEAERTLHQIFRRGGVRGWSPNVVVRDRHGPIGEVDVAFPELRLAIEVDGRAWHVAGDRFQRDRTKQNRLAVAGWTVLRFTWADLTLRPDVVLATVRATIERLSR